MDLNQFRNFFEPNIKSWLNWDILPAETIIQEKIVTSIDELGQLLTVRYVDKKGNSGDWRDPSSRLLSISETRDFPKIWTRKSLETISLFRSIYSASTEPVQLVLPVYKVGESYLLLDSIHRCVAAFQSSCSVRVLVISICGPLDSKVLPDLANVAAILTTPLVK